MRRLIRFLLLTPFLLLIGFAAGGSPVTAGGGCHGGAGATAIESSATVVKVDGCTFVPTVTRVTVGTEVTFLNTSPSPHDVTGRMGEWGSDLLQAGASYKHRFASAGVFAYSCSLHPGMAGVVVAGGPNAALASEVVPTTDESVPAPADAGLQPLPLIASGALGLALGAMAMAAVRRRTAVEH